MNNIDYYIQKATDMENTSDGGSPAYHFDDVCLIKYISPIKYGQVRKNAEQVAQIANEKNAKGVRTPAHLGIKRVIDSENHICWVLQEKAKGRNFGYYCENRDSKVQLDMQSRLANAPDAHYEKLVSDFCELFNLGLELKSKNMFYDEALQDGGFTIIDLLGGTGEPLNPDSLRDVLKIYPQLRCYI